MKTCLMIIVTAVVFCLNIKADDFRLKISPNTFSLWGVTERINITWSDDAATYSYQLFKTTDFKTWKELAYFEKGWYLVDDRGFSVSVDGNGGFFRVKKNPRPLVICKDSLADQWSLPPGTVKALLGKFILAVNITNHVDVMYVIVDPFSGDLATLKNAHLIEEGNDKQLGDTKTLVFGHNVFEVNQRLKPGEKIIVSLYGDILPSLPLKKNIWQASVSAEACPANENKLYSTGYAVLQKVNIGAEP